MPSSAHSPEPPPPLPLAAGAVIRFRYEPTLADLLQFNRIVTLPGATKVAGILFLGLLAPSLLSWGLPALIGRPGPTPTLDVLILPALLAAGLWVGWMLLLRFLAHRLWNRSEAVREAREYEFDENGLRATGSSFAGQIEWTSVLKTRRKGGYFFLHIGGNQYYHFPAAVVPDPALLESLLARKVAPKKSAPTPPLPPAAQGLPMPTADDPLPPPSGEIVRFRYEPVFEDCFDVFRILMLRRLRLSSLVFCGIVTTVALVAIVPQGMTLERAGVLVVLLGAVFALSWLQPRRQVRKIARKQWEGHAWLRESRDYVLDGFGLRVTSSNFASATAWSNFRSVRVVDGLFLLQTKQGPHQFFPTACVADSAALLALIERHVPAKK